MQYAKVRGVSLFFNTRTLRHVVVVSLQCKRHGRHDQHTDKLIKINETRQNQRSTKRTQVLFLPRENISNAILGSSGQALLVCTGAHFLCVIRKRVCVCVCTSMYMCVHIGACSSVRSEVVLSAKGERNAQIKHGE